MKLTAILAEWYAALPTDRQQTIAQHDAAPNLSLNLQAAKVESGSFVIVYFLRR